MTLLSFNQDKKKPGMSWSYRADKFMLLITVVSRDTAGLSGGTAF